MKTILVLMVLTLVGCVFPMNNAERDRRIEQCQNAGGEAQVVLQTEGTTVGRAREVRCYSPLGERVVNGWKTDAVIEVPSIKPSADSYPDDWPGMKPNQVYMAILSCQALNEADDNVREPNFVFVSEGPLEGTGRLGISQVMCRDIGMKQGGSSSSSNSSNNSSTSEVEK